MKKITFLILFSFFLVLGGCATRGQLGWAPEKREQITTRIYNYNSQHVFASVVDMFERNGYSIDVINRDEGIIKTLPRTFGATLSSYTATYYVRIIPEDENKTKVRAIISGQGSMYVPSSSIFRSGSYAPTGDEVVGEIHYKRFFNGLDGFL